jgi:hypothetical protein
LRAIELERKRQFEGFWFRFASYGFQLAVYWFWAHKS